MDLQVRDRVGSVDQVGFIDDLAKNVGIIGMCSG